MATKLNEAAPIMEWKLMVAEPGAAKGQVWCRRNSRVKQHMGWQFVGAYGTCEFLDAAGRYNRARWLRSIVLKEEGK